MNIHGNRHIPAETRRRAETPLPQPIFRGTDERGNTLMVLRPDEVEALRRYWAEREPPIGERG